MAETCSRLPVPFQIDHRSSKGHAIYRDPIDGRVVKAGSVALDTAGNVALIRQQNGTGWTLPKGHLEPKILDAHDGNLVKALAATAVQETAQEAGRRVLVKADALLANRIADKHDEKIRIYWFMAHILGEAEQPAECETVMFSPEDALHLVQPAYGEVLRRASDQRTALGSKALLHIPTQPLESAVEQLAWAI